MRYQPLYKTLSFFPRPDADVVQYRCPQCGEDNKWSTYGAVVKIQCKHCGYSRGYYVRFTDGGLSFDATQEDWLRYCKRIENIGLSKWERRVKRVVEESDVLHREASAQPFFR